MKMSENTILITGGASGIGFELATQLLALGNTVIITGRDQARLDAARKKLPKVHTLQSDVSDPKAIPLLFEAVTAGWPELNILANNAGIMRKVNLTVGGSDLEDVSREIVTNLVGPIHLIQQFVPHLKARREAAIVNVSSGLAFIPFPLSPVYCASKAGLHSYTQSLRVQLKNTSVKVFELAPPATDTPLNGIFSANELDSRIVMDAPKLVAATIRRIEKDKLEIPPGLSNILKLLSRLAPEFALKVVSKPVEAMLAKEAVPHARLV